MNQNNLKTQSDFIMCKIFHGVLNAEISELNGLLFHGKS